VTCVLRFCNNVNKLIYQNEMFNDDIYEQVRHVYIFNLHYLRCMFRKVVALDRNSARANKTRMLKHVTFKKIYNKMCMTVSTFLLALILNSGLFSFRVKLEYLSRIFALVPCC